MAKFNKLVGIVAAAAVLTTLAPMGASAAVVTEKAVAKADTTKPHATDQILVKAKAGKDLKANAKKHGATKVEELSGAWKLVKVPAGKAAEFVDKFNADADIELAELDYIHTINYTPNDPSYASQYHLTKIQANYAWDIHTGGSGATIAIIDTGVDIQHPDLSSKIVAGYDYVNNDSNADDDQGHGTHCAGIATASTNNGTNGAGVSWNARIMPIKVLSSSGSGTTSNIIKGVDFARMNGADVISMSLGGGGYTAAFQTAITNAWNAGVVVVAAAGNNGNTTVQYPAGYTNVISVASTDSADKKSSFSTYGTWVDVAAPGSSIYSTKNGGGMTTMSGTSMATPVVAGLAALLRTKNTGASAAAIRDRIFNTADPITGTGSSWWYGRVNAYDAVNGF